MWWVVALVVLGVIALVAAFGRGARRQQQDMAEPADDLRRADDGGDEPFSDYGSPMG